MATTTKIHDDVKNYYGNVLETNQDLQTTACCSIGAIPKRIKDVLSLIEPEVLEKFYGCGSPIPHMIEGCIVLDLGCGAGRDSFTCSKLVGENGKVIGVDMTDEQLEVANRNIDAQMEIFEFSTPNIEFKKGYIEDLAEAGIKDNSVDVVISNCVINLAADKQKVFSEIFRVLKPGGELYFSDVYASRRITEEMANDPLLRGECLSGALYIEDFRRMLFEIGCKDYREMSRSIIEIENEEIREKLSGIEFYSITVRAFKIDSIEDRCEDYGQVAWYLGGMPHTEKSFTLDDHHVFEAGRPMLVCGNTAAMLEETRFGKYFRIDGDRSTHFGLFDCGPSASAQPAVEDCSTGACC